MAQTFASKASDSSSASASALLPGTTPLALVRSVFKRFFRVLATLPRPRKGRFVPLSPSVARRQYLLDRRTRRLLRFEIRDGDDLGTLGQVFLFDHHGTEKLSRHAELVAYYEATLRGGKVPLIIDAGGNAGFASRYFAETYPQARILCIEPVAANLAQARINNPSPKVVFFECAIGSAPGRGAIEDPGLGHSAYRINQADSGPTPIISIDGLLREFEPDNCVPFIVKIDIEGFEVDLFSQHTAWIEKFPLLIVELHDWMLPHSASSGSFLRAIAPLHRDFVFHGENVFSLSNTLLQTAPPAAP